MSRHSASQSNYGSRSEEGAGKHDAQFLIVQSGSLVKPLGERKGVWSVKEGKARHQR